MEQMHAIDLPLRTRRDILATISGGAVVAAIVSNPVETNAMEGQATPSDEIVKAKIRRALLSGPGQHHERRYRWGNGLRAR